MERDLDKANGKGAIAPATKTSVGSSDPSQSQNQKLKHPRRKAAEALQDMANAREDSVVKTIDRARQITDTTLEPTIEQEAQKMANACIDETKQSLGVVTNFFINNVLRGDRLLGAAGLSEDYLLLEGEIISD